ncbi:hypothetical protein AB0L82_00870 [Nocardia sp. NPDC052001]|uniref:LppU/SCO3897 family protein n=1 Tax=Nocardia sp. NPDC052001 TaxID=3154853 RepID=UPI003426E0FE
MHDQSDNSVDEPVHTGPAPAPEPNHPAEVQWAAAGPNPVAHSRWAPPPTGESPAVQAPATWPAPAEPEPWTGAPPTATAGWGAGTIPPGPVPPGSVPPGPWPTDHPVEPPQKSWTRRPLVWAAVAVAFVVAVAGSVAGYLVTRPDPLQRFAFNACVSITSNPPVEFDCADPNALYRIAAREDVKYPLESVCTKYPDVTRAVAEPVDAGEKVETVLCLAPTRINMNDPGAVQAGDCVDVKGAGDTILRVPCGTGVFGAKVLAVEMHLAVPVTDQACKNETTARQAYAQASLGGRAIVLCVTATDPTYLGSAVVGDCLDRNVQKIVACTAPEASKKVLKVSTGYQQPVRPQCPDIVAASAFSMTSNDKTDLVLSICLGPADQSDSGYATFGDCIAVDGTGTSARTRRLDCGDPAARFQVTDVHQPNDANCPPGSPYITIDPGISLGATVCVTRR